MAAVTATHHLHRPRRFNHNPQLGPVPSWVQLVGAIEREKHVKR